MRLLRRVIVLGVLVFALGLGVGLYGAILSDPCTDVDHDPFDIAVVLGGGMDVDGRLHYSTLGRVEMGVALYNTGTARAMHMTGGVGRPGGPAAGAQMAKVAEAMGVQSADITHEDASQSTLQNGLFSARMLPKDASVILVSEGFHLTRGRLSFWWAGLPVQAVCHSTRFREPSTDAATGAVGMLVREAVAFWFNLGRAAIWSVGDLIGMEGPEFDAILE